MSNIFRSLALLTILLAGPAYAFKEVPVAPATGSQLNNVQADPTLKQPTLNLSGADGELESGGGVELKIPGIGTVGTLPKLDFGLELLYGATDQELPENELEKIEPSEDMTIRGTLKHNF